MGAANDLNQGSNKALQRTPCSEVNVGHRSAVQRLVTVQGASCHIPHGKELWLLVVPEGVTAYYPQAGPVVVSNDNWSASAYVGVDKPSDNGRGFLLIAALADQSGSAAIRG